MNRERARIATRELIETLTILAVMFVAVMAIILSIAFLGSWHLWMGVTLSIMVIVALLWLIFYFDQ